jgi:hypothetical protein
MAKTIKKMMMMLKKRKRTMQRIHDEQKTGAKSKHVLRAQTDRRGDES